MLTDSAQTILLVHCDQSERHQLAGQLTLDGYTVHAAPTTASALATLERVAAGLLVIGILGGPAEAIGLLRTIRAGRAERVDPNLPTITLGRTDAVTQLRAYDAGSDHHLPADTGYVVLRSVIVALLRRAQGPTQPRRLGCGPLSIDLVTREVTVGCEPVELTAREFDLLTALATDPERVYTKAELLADVWGYRDVRTTRTLDSHACRLRKRIADAGYRGTVRNVWGVGYRLAP